MRDDLLVSAVKRAKQSEPAVRAAALMHIARVLARSDEAAAVALLKRGLTLAKSLDAETTELLLNNAVFLAAAVSPRDAFQLYADQKNEREKRFGRHGSPVVGLANAMAQHGHIRDLLEYFDDPPPGERFPLYFVGNLSRECPDDETRLKLLRLSAQAFRNQDQDDSHPHERHAFGSSFARYWHLLPAGEARPLLLEIVHAVLKQEAESHRFPLTPDPGEPELTEQEHLMFGLLPAVQSLEPDLSQSLFQKHPQLAAAAQRYPKGMQSIWDSHVSGGVKGSHFRRDEGVPAASRLMAGHTTTAAARVATKGRVYSLPEPINPQATLPRRQQESQNWRAGCVGQEASVAANTRRWPWLALFLSALRSPNIPLPLLPRFSVH